jgi:hypothetical protein
MILKSIRQSNRVMNDGKSVSTIKFPTFDFWTSFEIRRSNMFRQAIVCVVACAAAFGWMTASADAAVLQFEAESASLMAPSGWSVVANGSASGGSVLQANGTQAFQGNLNNPLAEATYTINFTEAGTYDLYARFVMAADGNTDSLFFGANFGAIPSIEENNLGFVGGTPNGTLNGLPLVTGQTASLWQQIATAGTIVWVNLSANIREAVPTAAANNNEVPTYTVAAPGNQTFRIGTRENNMAVDALAFALASEAGDVRVNLAGGLFVIGDPDPDIDGMNGPDLADFHILRGNYLTAGAHSDGDVDFNGFIDHVDFFLWRSAFLGGGGSLAAINWAPVPEPTTAMLLLTGGLAMVSARRARRQR